jgi:phage tail-like protein
MALQPRTTTLTPYGAFNFQVIADAIGNKDPGSPQAGFQEISGLGMEVTEAEYRNGNDGVNHVRKVSGLYKSTDVTFKRGIIGFTDFFAWIQSVRDGNLANQAPQTVTVNLMDEVGTSIAMQWTLTGAKPKSYKGATLNAKGGTDVAMEEMVLSVEKIDVVLNPPS